MKGIKQMENIINWLLEEKEPSIRYRTLTELLSKPENDSEVIEAKEAVLQSKNVCRLFDRLDDRGLFPHIQKCYGNFTTFSYDVCVQCENYPCETVLCVFTHPGRCNVGLTPEQLDLLVIPYCGKERFERCKDQLCKKDINYQE